MNSQVHGRRSSAVFSSIDWQAERVAIVASGPSFFDPKTDAHVLSVKGTIKHLNKVDSWFTLDVNERCVPILEHPRKGVRYVAAVPSDYGSPKARIRWHRWAYPHVTYLRREPTSPSGLAQDKGVVYSGNSAWGALQVAVHMGAKRIVLIGVDGNADPYGYSPRIRIPLRGGRYIIRGAERPRGKLDHLPALFATAVLPQGVQVVNASATSNVNCFPRMSPKEAIRWLEE